METLLPATLCIAIAMGAYITAMGIGLLFDPKRLDGMIGDFDRQPALLVIVGMIAFAIGAGLLAIHHHWTDPLAVIVTLLLWAAMIEGLVIMAFPGLWLAIARPFIGQGRLTAILCLLLGIALLIAGFTGRATPILA